VLNSSSFGVPQHRRRVVVVAGPGPIVWPEPTHGDPATLNQGSLFGPRLKAWVSCGEALGLTSEQGMAERNGGSRRGWAPVDTAPPARVETRAATEPQRLEQPAPTVTTTEANGTRGDNMGKKMASGATRGGVDRASDALWLATGRRRLEVRETLILMGVRPDYPLQGTKTARYRIVGNGCTPAVFAAVGRAVLGADT